MLIKFFRHGTGKGADAVNYCTQERDAMGKRREPAPEIVAGDPEQTIDLIDSLDFKHKYTSGVLSFAPEDQPTEEQQRELMADFERTAFAGMDREQYAILWVRHQHLDRLELHFVTPRVELTTGKSLNIAPPGWAKTFAPLRDAWNYEQAWARPDDPNRARVIQPGYTAYIDAAALRSGLAHRDRDEGKQLITDYLIQRIDAGLAHNRNDVMASLEEVDLHVTRQGREYISVQDMETGTKYRLKGLIYGESFDREQFDQAIAEQAGSRSGEHREHDAERATAARAELETAITKRADIHAKKYGQRDDQRDATLDANRGSHLRTAEQDRGMSAPNHDDFVRVSHVVDHDRSDLTYSLEAGHDRTRATVDSRIKAADQATRRVDQSRRRETQQFDQTSDELERASRTLKQTSSDLDRATSTLEEIAQARERQRKRDRDAGLGY